MFLILAAGLSIVQSQDFQDTSPETTDQYGHAGKVSGGKSVRAEAAEDGSLRLSLAVA